MLLLVFKLLWFLLELLLMLGLLPLSTEGRRGIKREHQQEEQKEEAEVDEEGDGAGAGLARCDCNRSIPYV